MKYFKILWFYILISSVYCILPDDFDALMEKFFATPECESFVSDGTYLSVATSACSPYTCDSPRQLCMRESDRFHDESANQCRNVPEACLTAANDGISVSSSGPTNPTNTGGIPPPPPPPRPFNSGNFGDICQQTTPEGNFCGYQLKFTYNRETKNCEQFWFAGCASEKTNDNLFGDLQSCQIATQHCQSWTSNPTPYHSSSNNNSPPTTPPPPPPPPPPQPPIKAFPDYPNSGEEIPPAPPPPPVAPGGIGGLMGGGGGSNVGGLVGQFLGGGLGGSPQASNFQGLIQTLGAVAKPAGAGGAPGGGAEALLTNFNPQQFTSLFSSL